MAEVWVIENSDEYRFPASAIARELGLVSHADVEIDTMATCEVDADASAD